MLKNNNKFNLSYNRPNKKVKLSFFKVFRYFLVFMLTVTFATVGIAIGSIYGMIKNTSPLDNSLFTDIKINSTVYDANKEKVTTLRDSDINREWAELNEIPENLQLAFIAIEDKRYYEHNGVDYHGLIAAVFSKLTHPTQQMRGASTLTMQLVKNLTENDARAIERKVIEQYLAIKLEDKLTEEKGSKEKAKKVILEKYLNQINLGGNMNGVKTAAKYYFDKELGEDKLTLAECACLASITKHPVIYAPDPSDEKSENNKNNADRRAEILKIMLKEDFITENEYNEALNEKIAYKEGSLSGSSSKTYFVDAVITQLQEDLVEGNSMNSQEALSYIHSGGLKIYTTLDKDIQNSMDKVFTDESNFPTSANNEYETQAAMVLLDQHTGYVKALYGGYGKKESGGYNRATSSEMQRSPGSTIKPVAVYGPAIDSKTYTAASVIDDIPLHLNDEEPSNLYPTNDDNTYKGLLPLRTCLKESRNVPAMQIWKNIKSTSITNYLNKSGFNELTEENTYNSTALGGGIKANPLKMAGAYTTLANNEGIYTEPILYTKVVDNNGEVIIDKTKSKNENIKQEKNAVYTKQGAYIMTDLLTTVCESGTAAGLVNVTNKNNEKIPVAGKTGTTNDNTDRWFVGYTPYFVGSVWYGDDNSKSLPSMQNPAAKIWQKVMQNAHENLESKEFTEPENIVTSEVCKYSGMYPSDACQYDMRRDAITEEIFIQGTQPTAMEACTTHKKVEICEQSTIANNNTPMLVTDKCPNNVKNVVSLIVRQEPFEKEYDSDPYPNDWIYEYNEDNICDIHNGFFDDNTWDDFFDDWKDEKRNNDDNKDNKKNDNKNDNGLFDWFD